MRQSRGGITKEFTALYADGSSSGPPAAASHGGMSSGSTCRRLVEAWALCANSSALRNGNGEAANRCAQIPENICYPLQLMNIWNRASRLHGFLAHNSQLLAISIAATLRCELQLRATRSTRTKAENKQAPLSVPGPLG